MSKMIVKRKTYYKLTHSLSLFREWDFGWLIPSLPATLAGAAELFCLSHFKPDSYERTFTCRIFATVHPFAFLFSPGAGANAGVGEAVQNYRYGNSQHV